MEFTLLRDVGESNMSPVLCLDGVVRTLTEFNAIARTTLADQALPDALRGAKYRVGTDGVLTYLGREPMTPEFVVECYEHYVSQNPYNQDWPHVATECDPEAIAQAERVRERLQRELEAVTAAPVEIVAVVPRYLLYFTDGSLSSQQHFLTVAPKADTVSPFRLDGVIKPAFLAEYTPIMRDMKVPLPPALQGQKNVTPLLYRGRAFAVEFLVAHCDPAFNNCRVYVDWHGDFICSDWCQRASKAGYDKGKDQVDLQTNQYTFPSWVTSSAMVRAQAEVRACKDALEPYRPERFSIKKLLDNSPPPVPTLAVALETIARRDAEFRTTPPGRVLQLRDAFVAAVDAAVETLPATLSDDAIAEQLAAGASVALLLQTPLTRTELASLPDGFPVRTLQYKETATDAAVISQDGPRTRFLVADGTALTRVQHVYADRETLRDLVRAARFRLTTPTPAPEIGAEAMAAASAAVAEYVALRRFATKYARVQHATRVVTGKSGPQQVLIGTIEVTFEPLDGDQVKVTLLDDIVFYGWQVGESYMQSLEPRGQGAETTADLGALGYLLYYFYHELGAGV